MKEVVWECIKDFYIPTVPGAPFSGVAAKHHKGEKVSVLEDVELPGEFFKRVEDPTAEFRKKRLAYFRRAAEKGEWVQLGKGDLEMLDEILRKS